MIVNRYGKMVMNQQAIEKAKKKLELLREAREAEWEMDRFFKGEDQNDRLKEQRK